PAPRRRAASRRLRAARAVRPGPADPRGGRRGAERRAGRGRRDDAPLRRGRGGERGLADADEQHALRLRRLGRGLLPERLRLPLRRGGAGCAGAPAVADADEHDRADDRPRRRGGAHGGRRAGLGPDPDGDRPDDRLHPRLRDGPARGGPDAADLPDAGRAARRVRARLRARRAGRGPCDGVRPRRLRLRVRPDVPGRAAGRWVGRRRGSAPRRRAARVLRVGPVSREGAEARSGEPTRPERRWSAAFRRRHEADREILALAVPALGALAADPLVSLVDTAYVGRLGVVPLAALGVNVSIFGLAFLVFNFLAYGTTPMVARAVGSGDRVRAGRLAVEALTLAVVAGAMATAVLQLLAVPIVRAMGATGELVAPAVEYLRIRALAGPAVLIITASNGIFRGWQDTRTPFLVALVVNAVNLVLDPILIFGVGLGLRGAAIATVVAQWTGAAAFLWLILGARREA